VTHYHHEYRPRRTTSVSIHVHTGPTYYAPPPVYVAPTYGYAYAHHHVAYHPYWHCSPVVYRSYYGPPVYVAPIYAPVYAPVYPVVVEPATYSTSSFAFGFSSFGGGSVTSFGFAYSSRRYTAAYGWCPTPVYTIYTPVVVPHYRSVWIPGRYVEVVERVWVPGRYVDRIRPPVVEAVYDPLGNEYEVVVVAGAVECVYEPGAYVYETRRIWRSGYYETVAVF
jgi:hypothetical protein